MGLRIFDYFDEKHLKEVLNFNFHHGSCDIEPD
jgi:hypothetical protein